MVIIFGMSPLQNDVDFFTLNDMPIFAHEIDEKGVEEKLKNIVNSVSEQLDQEQPKVGIVQPMYNKYLS